MDIIAFLSLIQAPIAWELVALCAKLYISILNLNKLVVNQSAFRAILRVFFALLLCLYHKTDHFCQYLSLYTVPIDPSQ